MQGLKGVNFESVYDSLKKLDDSDANTWKEKDPTKQALEKWWDDGHDPTQYKGPLPDKHPDGRK